jgi:ferritin
MKTEQEIQTRINDLIMLSLKNEYSFFYDHLKLHVREKLEDELKNHVSDSINDTVNENLHSEQLDQYHSSISTSLEFEEVKEFMSQYEESMKLVKEIYESE